MCAAPNLSRCPRVPPPGCRIRSVTRWKGGWRRDVHDRQMGPVGRWRRPHACARRGGGFRKSRSGVFARARLEAPPSATAHRPELAGKQWEALGVSLCAASASPVRAHRTRERSVFSSPGTRWPQLRESSVKGRASRRRLKQSRGRGSRVESQSSEAKLIRPSILKAPTTCLAFRQTLCRPRPTLDSPRPFPSLDPRPSTLDPPPVPRPSTPGPPRRRNQFGGLAAASTSP